MTILIINEKMLIFMDDETQYKTPAKEGIHNVRMRLVFTHERYAETRG